MSDKKPAFFLNDVPVSHGVSKPPGQKRMTPAQIAEQEAFNFQFARMKMNPQQYMSADAPTMAEGSMPPPEAGRGAEGITGPGGGGASTGVSQQDIQDTSGSSIQDTTGEPIRQAGA